MVIAERGQAAPLGAPAHGRRTLTSAERRQYDEQGFVIVPGVIPVPELEAVDREIDTLLDRLMAERRERGEERGAAGNGHHEESGSVLQLG